MFINQPEVLSSVINQLKSFYIGSVGWRIYIVVVIIIIVYKVYSFWSVPISELGELIFPSPSWC
jgi:hypothetical protein